MAGTRIQGGFASYVGTEYDIFIYDAEFVASLSTNPNVIGDPATGDVWGWESDGGGNVMGWSSLDELENPPGIQVHKVALPGFSLEYETQNQNIFHPLMPSRLSFSLLFEDEVQETFLNALANSYEGQFLVRVLRNGTLFWAGVLLPDVVEFRDQYYPYDFRFVAVDGLSRLKSIPYPASLLGGSKSTLMEIVYTCLGYVETNGFYDVGDDYFVNNLNWWASNHVPSFLVDPLNLTRVNPSVFYDKDPAQEGFEFFSCYQVLEQICLIFGARFFYSDGNWWMQQMTMYDNSVQTARRYNKNAAQLFATGGQSYERLCDQVKLARTNGKYEFTAPLKSATVTYIHRSGAGTLLGGVQWLWSEDGDQYNVGAVSNNDGKAKISFKMTVEHTYRQVPYADMPAPDLARHHFALRLQVGTYYYVGNETSGAGWVTTPGDYIFYTLPVKQWENHTNVFELITSEVPESGNFFVTFGYLLTENIPSNTTVVLPLQISTIFDLVPEFEPSMQYWGQLSPQLVVLADGEQIESLSLTRYRASNANTSNSKIEEITVYLGDGPTTTTISKLEIWNGSAWVDSSSLWGRSLAGPRVVRLLEYLAQQIVTMYLTPRIKYVGQIINADARFTFLDPYHRLKINNRFYVFLGGQFEAVTDTWTDIHYLNIKTEQTVVPTAPLPK